MKLGRNSLSHAHEGFTLVELLGRDRHHRHPRRAACCRPFKPLAKRPAARNAPTSSGSSPSRSITITTRTKHLPTGGWSWHWVGYPEYGFGREQPGGWMYNVLPFMEEDALHDYGKGLTAAARNTATRDRVQRPFEGMTCPSRRRANVYPLARSN